MFNLAKLNDKARPKVGQTRNKKDASKSPSKNKTSNVNKTAKKSAIRPLISELNEYLLKDKLERNVYSKNTNEAIDDIAKINTMLNDCQSRTSVLPALRLIIERCKEPSLKQYFNHWFSCLLQIVISSETAEQEAACELLVKLVSRSNPSLLPEMSQLIATLANYILGKNRNNNKNDDKFQDTEATLLMKLKLLKQLLTTLPTLSGPFKGKFDKFVSPLISHKSCIVQELAAQCTALLPVAGGGGPAGHLHQLAWSQYMNNSLAQMKDLLVVLQEEINGGNKNAANKESSFFDSVHQMTGLVKVFQALLESRRMGGVKMDDLVDIISGMFDLPIGNGYLATAYISHLHGLALSILESLLSKFNELLSPHASFIYRCINQVLVRTNKKKQDESSDYCCLRRSAFVCLGLCFDYHLFPPSISLLKCLVDMAWSELLRPTAVRDFHSAVADKMNLSTTSQEAYSGKRKNKQQGKGSLTHVDLTSFKDAKRCEPTNEEIDMCVAAVQALQCLLASNSKALILATQAGDKSLAHFEASEKSKEISIMSVLTDSIWNSLVPLLRKLQWQWHSGKSYSSPSIYDYLEIQIGLYQLLASLLKNSSFCRSSLYTTAHQVVNHGLNSTSPKEVRQLCRSVVSTVVWSSSLTAPAGQSSSSDGNDNDLFNVAAGGACSQDFESTNNDSMVEKFPFGDTEDNHSCCNDDDDDEDDCVVDQTGCNDDDNANDDGQAGGNDDDDGGDDKNEEENENIEEEGEGQYDDDITMEIDSLSEGSNEGIGEDETVPQGAAGFGDFSAVEDGLVESAPNVDANLKEIETDKKCEMTVRGEKRKSVGEEDGDQLRKKRKCEVESSDCTSAGETADEAGAVVAHAVSEEVKTVNEDAVNVEVRSEESEKKECAMSDDTIAMLSTFVDDEPDV